MQVRTRIAPSPTGYPHVGTLYMALFNQIFAAHHQGQFVLRIEDTDKVRSKSIYEKNIYESLKWLGLQWDEGPDIGGNFGPYRQSERTDLYRKACYSLLKAGKAYKCFTSPRELEEMRLLQKKLGRSQGYNRKHRNLTPEEIAQFEADNKPYVIRLKVPLQGDVTFTDAVKGHISTPCADIDDQVLLKSDGFPTYHLANVVDDHAMQITHVIRGDEWISSTPKHILLYEAFQWEPPTFVHMPLLLGIDGKKLSKRKNPTSAFYYRDSGYLPEAFCNFLTLMGYSMPDNQEIYSLETITQTFSMDRIGLSGAVFDLRKLDWMNQQYLIHSIPTDNLWQQIQSWGFPPTFMHRLMPLIHTRMKTFGDFIDLCGFFFVNHLPYTTAILCPKNLPPHDAACIIQMCIWLLEEHEEWHRDALESTAHQLTDMFGMSLKKCIIPILFAVFMGKHQGPPLFDSFALLGPHKARARLLEALQFLGGLSNKQVKNLQQAYQAKDAKHLIKAAISS